MASRRLVLASASPARLRLLRDAGFDPEVIVSGVAETRDPTADTATVVRELARRKAEAVAGDLAAADALVVGCDSLLELDGHAYGKPDDETDARARWTLMRSNRGVLHTGQCVVDVRRGTSTTATASTTVRFAQPGDDEIDAYIATGEPLRVAGAFTLDGRGAPFVESIEGDAGTVIGLSLPLLRMQLRELGIAITELWC